MKKILALAYLIVLVSCTCYNDQIISLKKEVFELDRQIRDLEMGDSIDEAIDETIILWFEKVEKEERIKELEAKSHCL